MTMQRGLSATIAALALAGCATQPTIQRWESVSNLPDSQPPSLRVSSAPATSPAALAAKSLPDHAGAAYITALAAVDKKPKDLRADIARPMKAPPSGLQDGTVFDRVLTVSVERALVRPGDRLLMTRVTIKPADPNVTFTNYESAAAAHSTVNIGTVTISDTYSASAGVAPGGGAAGAALGSASLSASRTEGASRNVNQDSVLSVTIQPDSIEIFRTGAEDRELIGDTLIKLSLRYGQLVRAPNYWVANATIQGDKGLSAPRDATIDLAPIALFPPHDLWVCAAFDYEDREVADPSSEDEGKQAVTIVSRHIPPAANKVVPYLDLQQLLWRIVDPGGSAVGFSDGLVVHDLSFDDYDGAAEFLAWMKLKRPTTIKNGRLGENLGAKLRDIVDFDQLQLSRVEATVGAAGDPPSCPPDK
jgi:hypothetical protein